MAMDMEGLAYLGDVAAKLRTIDPTFDPRTFGFENMKSVFKSFPHKYELIYKAGEGQSKRYVYVRPIKHTH